MTTLHLTDTEFQSIAPLTDLVGELTILQTMEFHGNLLLSPNGVAAERDRSKMVRKGGRDKPLTILIPADVYHRLVEIAFSKGLRESVLGQMLNISMALHTVPIDLRPGKHGGPPDRDKRMAKGDTKIFNMDTLVAGKDITITALDGSDVVLSDPAAQTVTADADGLARVAMIVPTGYADNKIKFKIFKNIVDVDEFGTGNPATAITDDSEVHELTVTA